MKKNKTKRSEKKKKVLSFKLLQKEVESYGYTYSFKSFMIHMVIAFAFVIGVAFLAKLHWFAILLLCLVTLGLMPFIIKAQFNQLHNIDRFEMVVNYLNNALPVFKQTPKILYTLENVVEMTSGEMQKCILETIEYIKTNTNDTDLYRNAFKIIEDKFPNSRIHTLHQAMITVETESSRNYFNTLDNIYYDIQGWISRTYGYQKDLKKTKTNLLILSIITLCMSMLFVLLYGTTEYFSGFTDMLGYQIMTSIFMIGMMSIICVMQIKLNGQWLVDDRTRKNNEKVMKAYHYIENYSSAIPKPILFIAVLLMGLGVVLIVMDQILFGLILLVFGILFLTMRNVNYKSRKKQVLKALNIEFPIWLREIALNLHNLVVVNAIENSCDTSAEILKPFLNNFLLNLQKTPTSIEPYNDLFKGYDFPDAQTSMKILYTVQGMDESEMDRQVNSLIERNQELLGKSEKMRNQDSLSTLEMIGFVPVLMTLFLMVGNMVLLFVYMMSMLANSINF